MSSHFFDLGVAAFLAPAFFGAAFLALFGPAVFFALFGAAAAFLAGALLTARLAADFGAVLDTFALTIV